MTLQLDHVVIAVDDLDAAIDHYQTQGFTVRRGGVHANEATHNALITLADSTYLELLAPTGKTPIPDRIDFGVLLPPGESHDSAGQVVGFALRTDDLDAEAVRLREAGFAVGEVMPGERRREDGTVVKWKLALLDDGFAPFLIQDVTPRTLRVPDDAALTTHANHVKGLHSIEIAVDDLVAARERYARLVGESSPPLGDPVGGMVLHALAPDQAPGPFAVQVMLADGTTRNLDVVGRGNS